jgi:hypothetical protein
MNHLVEFFEMSIDPELISSCIISVDFSHIVIEKQAIHNHEMQFHLRNRIRQSADFALATLSFVSTTEDEDHQPNIIRSSNHPKITIERKIYL